MSIKINDFITKFEELFDEIEVGTITSDTKFRDLDEWSSLMALSVIAMADEEFEVRLTGEDIRSSETVQDIYNKIRLIFIAIISTFIKKSNQIEDI